MSTMKRISELLSVATCDNSVLLDTLTSATSCAYGSVSCNAQLQLASKACNSHTDTNAVQGTSPQYMHTVHAIQGEIKLAHF